MEVEDILVVGGEFSHVLVLVLVMFVALIDGEHKIRIMGRSTQFELVEVRIF